MERNIRIHRDLPDRILQDTSVLKGMSVFYSMKFLYVGGVIKDMPSRYREIAGRIGISQSNLRSKVRLLAEMGLVKRQGRNLTFAGFNEIGRIFNLKAKRSFRVSHAGAKRMETIFKALSLEVNFERQRHKVRERIVNEELKRYGKIEAKGIQAKIRRHIRRNIAGYAERQERRASQHSPNRFEHRGINTDITISRQGMADMMGRKSKSTGSRLLRRMSSMGLVETDSKRVERICAKADRRTLRHLELDSSFFLFKGSLYKRMANSVSLSSFFA